MVADGATMNFTVVSIPLIPYIFLMDFEKFSINYAYIISKSSIHSIRIKPLNITLVKNV